MAKAERLKALIMCYWRFYKSCTLVAAEAQYADVIAINPSGMIIETELKLSIPDLKRDLRKYKHYLVTHPIHCNNLEASPKFHYFYFATPPELREKALEIINTQYPYAGYLVVKDEKVTDWWGRDITAYSPDVEVAIKATRIERPKMGKAEFVRLVKAQSGKLCRLMLDATEELDG